MFDGRGDGKKVVIIVEITATIYVGGRHFSDIEMSWVNRFPNSNRFHTQIREIKIRGGLALAFKAPWHDKGTSPNDFSDISPRRKANTTS